VIGKREKKILLLIFVFLAAVVPLRPASGTEVSVDGSRLYAGDHYINTISVSWKGDPSVSAPKYVKYEQSKGRSIVRISRKDEINYSSADAVPAGNTIFEIELTAKKPADSTKSKAVLVYNVGESGNSSEKAIEITEPVIRKKIFNIFKLSHLILICLGIAAAGLGGYRIAIFKRNRREKKNRTAHEAADRDLLELNSLGRLIEKKEVDVYINQANSFFEKMIRDLGTPEKTEETDDLAFIGDAEIKRKIHIVRKVLHDARFSGYVPTDPEKEDIYQACKSLYETKSSKILEK
jgi:hypothetical protein